MARLSLLIVVSSVLLGFAFAEPDYCKRGQKISEAYQHCFEDARSKYPYLPLLQAGDRGIIDGCMVEDYNNHTCRVVKKAALSCFQKNVSLCYYRERMVAIADESGGACYGNHINRDFKEHVLNYLQPVRADSKCFILGENAYECYGQAGYDMAMQHPNLNVYTVEEFMPVANKFFDDVYNCFIKIYKTNVPLCENWQIPLLLELQGIALPSLYGMTFTPEQMDRLELHKECPADHWKGNEPHWRNCYEHQDSGNKYPSPGPSIPSKPSKPGKPSMGGDFDHHIIPLQEEPEKKKKKKKKPNKKKNKNKKKGKGKKTKKGRKGKKERKGRKKKGGRRISPRFLERLRETLSKE